MERKLTDIIKSAEKLGYKTVERPKRPSHTKMFDYLDENK